MRRIRNSQLRLLAECPWAYAEAYVRDTPPLPSPALQRGANVHAAIRAAVHEIVGGAPTLNVHEIAYRVVRGDEATYRDALELLTVFTESLAEDFSIDPKGAFLVEEMLEMVVDVPGVGPCVFYGTPDLAERTSKTRCRITDFKTHFQPESRELFDADVQLPRYALLIHDQFPAFQEFEIVKRFVRYRNNAHTHVLTIDDLAQVRESLVQQIATEEDLRLHADFTPTPGSWCGLCGHHHTCPIIRAYRERGIDDLSIPNDERARELAGDAVALDAFAGELKDRLKVYLGRGHATGYVPLAGGSYGYGPMMERSIAVPELRTALTGAGVEVPDRLLRVDLDELDRFKRKLPESIVAVIDGVTESGTTSRCQFRKGAGDPRAPKKRRATAAVQETIL